MTTVSHHPNHEPRRGRARLLASLAAALHREASRGDLTSTDVLEAVADLHALARRIVHVGPRVGRGGGWVLG